MFSTSRDPSCSPYSISYNAKCSNSCSTSVGNGSTGATGAQGAQGDTGATGPSALSMTGTMIITKIA